MKTAINILLSSAIVMITIIGMGSDENGAQVAAMTFCIPLLCALYREEVRKVFA